jgi:protein-tyrosine phosphatase
MTSTGSQARTSSTDPIRVDWLLPPGHSGIGGLGLTFAPGKKGMGISGNWQRDLDTDIAALRKMDTDVLVSLITDHELQRFRIPELMEVANAFGIEVIRFAIPDGGAPPMMRPVGTLLDEIAARVGSGKTLVVHCAGGLGRAGTIGACLLLRLGISGSAVEAIAHVRRVRSQRAIETVRQEEFITLYAAHLRGGQQ